MKSPIASIRIFFEPATLAAIDGGRLPLSALRLNAHVHGGLRIEIGGRLVPSLGFFGPDDVCFADWAAELEAIACQFRNSEAATYCYDEGEQGQPAFLFEKEGPQVFFSIVDSAFSGGRGSRAWQRVPFAWRDFVLQLAGFKQALGRELKQAAPAQCDAWAEAHLPPSWRPA